MIKEINHNLNQMNPKPSKNRINIPLVSRNVCGTLGAILMFVGIPFFIGYAAMLLEQMLRNTLQTINYFILIGSFVTSLLSGAMFAMGLSPRFRFRDDTEEALTDWDWENEMHQEDFLSKQKSSKQGKKIKLFISRNTLGILAMTSSFITLLALVLLAGNLSYITAPFSWFSGISLALSIGLWYIGLSGHFRFRGDP